MTASFTHTTLPGVDQRVHRLGLATNYGITDDDVREALDMGLRYVFWTPRSKKVGPSIKDAVRDRRDDIVLASGPTTAWWSSNVRKFTEKTLRDLGTDHLDVLQVFWAGVTSALTDTLMDEMTRLKDEGKTRAIGTSIHNRVRAGQLMGSSPLDLYMIRYNAAHPGAEKDIFPYKKDKHAVVAYTATSWRKLLKRPKGWEGRVPTAGDCYRFCLSSPHVHVTLTGPKTTEQLRENVAALEQGPMDGEEMAWMRELGAVVHG